MKIAVAYIDRDEDVEVLFDLDHKGVEKIRADFDRKGWDSQNWAVIIDTEKKTWEHYQVQYDEKLD